MTPFAIVSLRIYCSRGVFLIYIQFFSGMFFFNQSQPWICTYETNKNDRYVRVIRVHIHIYTLLLYVYMMIQLYFYSSVAACTMGTQVEIQYTTAVRVHVRGTYIHFRTCFAATNSNGSSSSSSSATAASFVCCCLPYAIYGSIDGMVLLLLHLNCIQ